MGFPGGAVVRTLALPLQGHGFNLWQVNYDPTRHTVWPTNQTKIKNIDGARKGKEHRKKKKKINDTALLSPKG